MTLLMLRKALLCDRSPATATKLMGRTLRTLIPKLETTDVETSPIRYDSKNICTEQVLKPFREDDSVRIRDTLDCQGFFNI